MLRKVNRGLVKNEGSLHSPLLSLNSFLADDDHCRLLITFANSLDPDQVRQKVSPDLDPKPLGFLIAFLKELFEKNNFDKKSTDNKSMENCPACKDTSLHSIDVYGPLVLTSESLDKPPHSHT